MGIGPAFAIPAALKKAEITKDDVDLYEVTRQAFLSDSRPMLTVLSIADQ